MEDEAWAVPDVCLLTAGSDGTVAVPDLLLTFVIIVAFAITMTLLLLSAVHVTRF